MSNRFVFRRKPENGEPLSKGEWRPMGENGVACSCPGCGTIARLDHDVDKNGVVSPSLVCPNEICGFHRMVSLEGWEPNA